MREETLRHTMWRSCSLVAGLSLALFSLMSTVQPAGAASPPTGLPKPTFTVNQQCTTNCGGLTGTFPYTWNVSTVNSTNYATTCQATFSGTGYFTAGPSVTGNI